MDVIVSVTDDLCKNHKCGKQCEDTDSCRKGVNKSKCGVTSGFGFVDTSVGESNAYTSAIANNPGKDLWLIQIIRDVHVQHMPSITTNVNVTELINSVGGRWMIMVSTHHFQKPTPIVY